MEQKKILWIVVAVCVFVLIIFGAALLLYAPSRSTGSFRSQASAITPATAGGMSANAVQSQSQIDPDSWVREPGSTPGLDKSLQPSSGNINLTIVNGDNTAANYGTLDVSDLTGSQPPVPADPSKALSLSEIPGQTPAEPRATTVLPQQTTNVPDAKTPTATGITSQATAPAIAKATAAASATKPAPVKAAPKKTVTVTEYWIQTGSFSSRNNAEKARETLAARYLNAEIFTKDVSGKTAYRVRVGPYKSKSEAEYWLGTVKEIPDFSASYVSEVKTKK